MQTDNGQALHKALITSEWTSNWNCPNSSHIETEKKQKVHGKTRDSWTDTEPRGKWLWRWCAPRLVSCAQTFTVESQHPDQQVHSRVVDLIDTSIRETSHSSWASKRYYYRRGTWTLRQRTIHGPTWTRQQPGRTPAPSAGRGCSTTWACTSIRTQSWTRACSIRMWCSPTHSMGQPTYQPCPTVNAVSTQPAQYPFLYHPFHYSQLFYRSNTNATYLSHTPSPTLGQWTEETLKETFQRHPFWQGL